MAEAGATAAVNAGPSKALSNRAQQASQSPLLKCFDATRTHSRRSSGGPLYAFFSKLANCFSKKEAPSPDTAKAAPQPPSDDMRRHCRWASDAARAGPSMSTTQTRCTASTKSTAKCMCAGTMNSTKVLSSLPRTPCRNCCFGLWPNNSLVRLRPQRPSRQSRASAKCPRRKAHKPSWATVLLQSTCVGTSNVAASEATPLSTNKCCAAR
mmetsp:Transcript_124909/g.400104  ORF Transcript_124909/g.400104 Transcript_124909/m.400104 type:complete len:210 (+) Transcript_124909:845-1474(+)